MLGVILIALIAGFVMPDELPKPSAGMNSVDGVASPEH